MANYNMKRKIETKLFNGYVLEPIPIIIFAIIVGVVLLILALWATWDILFVPSVLETSTEECKLVEYQRDGPIYRLESNKGYIYDLPVDSITDETLLENLIATQTIVIIKYELPIDNDAYSYGVLAIFDSNGVSIICQDTIYAAREKAATNSLLMIWIACVVYFIFALGSYFILCNAPKYPRIASLLIRAPYRNF